MRPAWLDPVMGFAEFANTRISAHPLPQIEDGDVMMLLLVRLSVHMAQRYNESNERSSIVEGDSRANEYLEFILECPLTRWCPRRHRHWRCTAHRLGRIVLQLKPKWHGRQRAYHPLTLDIGANPARFVRQPALIFEHTRLSARHFFSVDARHPPTGGAQRCDDDFKVRVTNARVDASAQPLSPLGTERPASLRPKKPPALPPGEVLDGRILLEAVPIDGGFGPRSCGSDDFKKSGAR
jgi:hypothetical protein